MHVYGCSLEDIRKMPYQAYCSLLSNIGRVYDIMYGGGDDDNKGKPTGSKGTASSNMLAQARAMGMRGVPRRM